MPIQQRTGAYQVYIYVYNGNTVPKKRDLINTAAPLSWTSLAGAKGSTVLPGQAAASPGHLVPWVLAVGLAAGSLLTSPHGIHKYTCTYTIHIYIHVMAI